MSKRLTPRVPRERRCRRCRCTDSRACPDGCFWPHPTINICSACVRDAAEWDLLAEARQICTLIDHLALALHQLEKEYGVKPCALPTDPTLVTISLSRDEAKCLAQTIQAHTSGTTCYEAAWDRAMAVNVRLFNTWKEEAR